MHSMNIAIALHIYKNTVVWVEVLVELLRGPYKQDSLLGSLRLFGGCVDDVIRHG